MRALALLLLALPCFGCSHATGGYGGDMEFGGSPRTARGALSVSEAGGEEPSLFKTDTNFGETVRRVELEAVGAGLADLGVRVVDFLSPAEASR